MWDQIEISLLRLVKNAGEKLELDVRLPGDVFRDLQGYDVNPEKRGNIAELKNEKVFLALVYPKDDDFSGWADAIVKAEELMDVLSDIEYSERKIQSEYNDLMQKIENVRNGSRNC